MKLPELRNKGLEQPVQREGELEQVAHGEAQGLQVLSLESPY